MGPHSGSCLVGVLLLVIALAVGPCLLLEYEQYWAVLYFCEELLVPVPKNKLELSQFQFHTKMGLRIWFCVQFLKKKYDSCYENQTYTYPPF
jgi:hypothetical protein